MVGVAIKKIFPASGGGTIVDSPVKFEAFKLTEGDEDEQAFADIGAVLMEVAGDLDSHGRTNLRDGGDDLALLGIEGNISE